MEIAGMAEVKLRPVTLSDLENAHELLSNWEVVRHMLLPLCSKQESEKFVRDAIDQSDSAPWRSIVRAVIDASDMFVGLCGIVILRGVDEGEIWYLVKPGYWGRGLATSAAAELIEFGFTELRLHRIWASCLPENPASARVLEKAGMRREGLRKRNLKIHGDWRDSFLYAILADEWQTRGKLARNPAAAVEENKAPVLRFVDRLINKGDPSVADEVLTADYVDHDGPEDQQRGPDGVYGRGGR
jgi:[ribosomal protein S5]-alanine N-acetyltransferase